MADFRAETWETQASSSLEIFGCRKMQSLQRRGATWGIVLAAVALVAGSQRPLAADERPPVPTQQVEFNSPTGTRTSISEVLAQFGDGSMLLLTPDGQLRTLHGEEIVSAEPTQEPLQPLSSAEIGVELLAELPAGFMVHETKHYVLAYNTSDIYVQWVGKLFERLHRGFYNFWNSKGVKLSEPRFPLVAVVFSDKASYMTYAEREVGESAAAMIGYYNMKTNRIITYDLTGVDGMVPQGQRVSSQAVINQILARPQAERTVATIVHEAVHQLSFNSGLQTRLADCPLWLSEGMAMFFEAPDVGNSQGWRTIGKVNYHNYRLFARNLPQRASDSLITLITDDAKFRDASTAARAYPESWALTYFLLKTKSQNVSEYLRELSQLPPLGEASERERLDMFKKHFGEDLAKLDKDFIEFMHRVR